MKKTVLFLAMMIAASTLTNVQAKNDKKKKKITDVVEQVVRPELKSTNDSLSYAAGMAATEGLMPYLNQQGIDSTTMKYFIESFKDALEKVDDPTYKAKMVGQQIAAMIKDRAFTFFSKDLQDTKDSLSLNMFKEGFVGVLNNDTTYFNAEKASKFFKSRKDAIVDAKNKIYKKENEDWLARNAKKEGMKTTASGLQYKVLVEGKGNVPTAKDKVTVKYEGRMIDGTVFDSSYKRNPQTTTFGCSDVIKGWTEALTMMPVGSKWEICIPQELAYGARQAGQIKPYSTLIFTVELVSIEKAKEEAKKTEATAKSKTVAGSKAKKNSK